MSEQQVLADYDSIEYRAFVTRMAELVGRHQVPVNADAADINDILEGDPVHYDLIHEVVRTIYRSGRCSHLDARVRAEAVFNALGGIRGRLLGERRTDIDQVNLLEELGWAARVVFAAAPGPDGRQDKAAASDADDSPVVLQYPAL